MGKPLRKIDLSHVNRLSLAPNLIADVGATEKSQAPVKPLNAFTEEDASFTQLVDINPLVGELQRRLNLVSMETGKAPKLLTREQLSTFLQQKEERQAQDRKAETDKLKQIALTAFKGERLYTKDEAVEILQTTLHITQDRAIKGLEMMFNSGLLEPIADGATLYVGGSTPF